MRGAAVLFLSVLAVTAFLLAFTLAVPEVTLTATPPSRYVSVPGLGEIPAEVGEQRVTLRFRAPESVLAFGVAVALTMGAAYAAYSERDLLLRKAIATAGILYGLGIGLLAHSRKDFRVAAPVLLPVGFAVLGLSVALRWMLSRRVRTAPRRRRAQSSRGPRPSSPGRRGLASSAPRGRRPRRRPLSPAWGRP